MDVDDPVAVYSHLVSTVPLMTRERELECLRHIRARDEQAEHARKDLIEANLAMVLSIVQHHPSEHVHILDLIQKGNDALMKSIDSFTESNPDDFAVFAASNVERTIRDAAAV